MFIKASTDGGAGFRSFLIFSHCGAVLRSVTAPFFASEAFHFAGRYCVPWLRPFLPGVGPGQGVVMGGSLPDRATGRVKKRVLGRDGSLGLWAGQFRGGLLAGLVEAATMR